MLKKCLLLYYIAFMLALIISAVFLFEFIVINGASLVSFVLAGMSLIQFFMFKQEADSMSDTAYSIREIDGEAAKRGMKYHALTKLIVIPLLVVPALYFNTLIKIIASFLIYALSFLVVPLLAKLLK